MGREREKKKTEMETKGRSGIEELPKTKNCNTTQSLQREREKRSQRGKCVRLR